MPQESDVQPERSFGRSVAEMRPVTLTPNVMKNADGSCLAEFGDTRVLCAATIAEGLPKWRGASRDGWVTAEYAMLPAATNRRTPREYKGRKGRWRSSAWWAARCAPSATSVTWASSR